MSFGEWNEILEEMDTRLRKGDRMLVRRRRKIDRLWWVFGEGKTKGAFYC